MIKRLFLSGAILWSLGGVLISQTIIQPNYSLKSHETLEIVKVEVEPRATIFYMQIENRIAGGTFCADRNIYMILPDSTRIKLISASGIPVCPDSFVFKTPGEKLDFTLTFPPLKKGTSCIDLIEECSDNCFSFYGIVLDIDLNKRINEAFILAGNDEVQKALAAFTGLLYEAGTCKGINGLLYINIIKLARQAGDEKLAAGWYRKFEVSGTPGLSRYIKYLDDTGIKY